MADAWARSRIAAPDRHTLPRPAEPARRQGFASDRPSASSLGLARLPTPRLVAEVVRDLKLLVKKEVALAKAEARADLAAGVGMAKWFALAGLMALWGGGMLFVTAAFALALVMPGWLAALVVAVALFLAAGLLAWAGWKRRIGPPLAATRRTIREDAAWARNGFK